MRRPPISRCPGCQVLLFFGGTRRSIWLLFTLTGWPVPLFYRSLYQCVGLKGNRNTQEGFYSFEVLIRVVGHVNGDSWHLASFDASYDYFSKNGIFLPLC